MPSHPMIGDDAATYTLIYDGECGLCRTLLALILRADTQRRLRPLALQDPEADRLLANLTRLQRDASFHLIAPDGTHTSAGAAMPSLLRLLPGGMLPAALLARAPRATERAYRLVTDHRSDIGPLIPGAAKRRSSAAVDARTREARAAPAARADG